MLEVMAFAPGAAQPQQNGGGGGNGRGRKHNRHEDQEEGKLFVGGLSWETTQDTLLRYFSRFGDVIDCVVMKNAETGRSRGFGFVTFSDPNNIDGVIQSCPHSLDGRTIDPKPCNPRSMQKPKKNTNWPKVFLGGLPSSITETDLRSFFSRYGRVTEVVIMYDQEKKKARGFGFLSFENDAAVDGAVAEHYVNIQNKQVEIKRAEPRNNPDMTNGPIVDQWGAPPTNGLGHAATTPSYSGWGVPPVPQGAVAPPVSVVSYSPAQPNHWGAPPHSQPSPGQHSWGAPPGAPPPQNSYAAAPHSAQAPPHFSTPQGHFHAAAPQSAPHTAYWGSPPGPTPPPSTHGDLYTQHPAPHHAAPPQSPPQHYNGGATFQLAPAIVPPSNYSPYPHTKPAPPPHYSSPTSPDYYATPSYHPATPCTPGADPGVANGALGAHRAVHAAQYVPPPAQPYHPYRRT